MDPSQLRRAGQDVVQHRCRHGSEEEDVGLGEDRLVSVAVDAPVGGDPLAADALGLDARRELSRQWRPEDRRGEDRRWLAQEPPPGSSGWRRLDARDPALRVPDLVERGQHLRSGPDAVEEGTVALADHRIGESLAGRVLLHLQVEAGQAHDRLLEGAPALAAALKPVVDLGEVRQDPRAGGVHDVVGVALEQRHQRLGLVERVALAGGHDPLQPVALATRQCVAHALHQATRLGRQGLDGAPDEVGEVRTQPRVRLELEGVGGLVQGDEDAELVARNAHRGRGADDVLLDEVQAPARRSGGEEADVVLPEDLAAEEREHEAELLVADGAVQPARHRAARGVRALLLLQHRALDALEEDAEGGEVQVDPLEPVDDRRESRAPPAAASRSPPPRSARSSAGLPDRTPPPQRAGGRASVPRLSRAGGGRSLGPPPNR